MDEKDLLTTPLLLASEMAALPRVSLQTLYNMDYRGEGPPSHNVGGRLRYDRGRVVAWFRAIDEDSRRTS